MGRSILSIIAGYLVLALAVGLKFAALGALVPHAFTSRSWLIFILGTDFLLMLAAGYITALIAKRAEVRHALALGALMVVLSIVSMMANAGQEPLWFQLALIIMALPGAASGGYLRAAQKSKLLEAHTTIRRTA